MREQAHQTRGDHEGQDGHGAEAEEGRDETDQGVQDARQRWCHLRESPFRSRLGQWARCGGSGLGNVSPNGITSPWCLDTVVTTKGPKHSRLCRFGYNQAGTLRK